jgi:hypothetical protein
VVSLLRAFPPINLGKFLVAKRLAASQGGLCSVELIKYQEETKNIFSSFLTLLSYTSHPYFASYDKTELSF